MGGVAFTPRQGITPAGRYRLVSRGWDGRLLGVRRFWNGTTEEGVAYVLGAAFRGVAKFPSWYVGLINDAGFAALAAADTHVSHPGWSEYAGLYNSLRVAWVPAAAAGALMDAANAVISITAAGSVRGAFLASTPAIGNAGGQVIYATGADEEALAVEAGGTVTVGYKLRLTPR